MSKENPPRQKNGGGSGEPLVLPGEGTAAKLPLPVIPGGAERLPEDLRAAWTAYMIQGFKQNEQMFQTTLKAFVKPYRLIVCFYAILFVVGVGLFVAACVAGFHDKDSKVTLSFAGLGTAAFLAFFVRNPLRALEKNLQCITWLGVSFNTYWTRLLYMSDPSKIQEELSAADKEFRASVEQLMARRAAEDKPKKGAEE